MIDTALSLLLSGVIKLSGLVVSPLDTTVNSELINSRNALILMINNQFTARN